MEQDYDVCWQTGHYVDQDCSNCPYRNECSGSEMDEDD